MQGPKAAAFGKRVPSWRQCRPTTQQQLLLLMVRGCSSMSLPQLQASHSKHSSDDTRGQLGNPRRKHQVGRWDGIAFRAMAEKDKVSSLLSRVWK